MRRTLRLRHRLFSSRIKSAGSGSIALVGTSTTVTIPAVDPDNTLLYCLGYSTLLNTGNSPASAFPRIDITGPTQITAYVNTNSGFQIDVAYAYVEYAPGVLRSKVQRGTVALSSAASASVTTNPVTRNRALVNTLGFTTNDTGTGAVPWADATTKHRAHLTADNQVTAYRYSAGSIAATVGYQIAEE